MSFLHGEIDELKADLAANPKAGEQNRSLLRYSQ